MLYLVREATQKWEFWLATRSSWKSCFTRKRRGGKRIMSAEGREAGSCHGLIGRRHLYGVEMNEV
jgi:hypothetical protein